MESTSINVDLFLHYRRTFFSFAGRRSSFCGCHNSNIQKKKKKKKKTENKNNLKKKKKTKKNRKQ